MGVALDRERGLVYDTDAVGDVGRAQLDGSGAQFVLTKSGAFTAIVSVDLPSRRLRPRGALAGGGLDFGQTVSVRFYGYGRGAAELGFLRHPAPCGIFVAHSSTIWERHPV